MPSPLPNRKEQRPQEIDWGRLIPGEEPAFQRGGRRPAQSVQPFATQKFSGTSAEAPANALVLILPHPLQGRMAWKWLRSTATDFGLVGLNWLSIGALLVPLRRLFPHIRLFEYAVGAPVSLLGVATLHASLITLLGYTEGLYAEGRDLQRQRWILGKSVLWATTVLCVAYGLQGGLLTTSSLICGAGVLHFGALLIWRWLEGTGDPGVDLRNVLIVGAGGVGRRLASYVDGHPEEGRTVCGFLDNERPLGNRVIGRVEDLARLARTEFVDEVILAAPHDRRLTLQVLEAARRLRLDVEMVPELFGCSPARTEVERVADLPVICLHAERLPAVGLVLKRVLDVVGGGIALSILSPLLTLLAGLVKLDSPGPVLYEAPRAGRKGQPFRCYKFRTMVRNADELKDRLRAFNQRSGPCFKIADDPRITRVGRFLRRYSLDELPQLWNVLKGEMSLVGPRPHPLDDVAGYEIEHLARLDVTPGMTGLWQVTARRDPSFQQAIELDREYIRTWSLGSDVKILLQTLLVVVQGSGD